jgi:hypothetical protein
MSAVEELREAARQLRAKAEAASPGWRVDVVGPIGAATVLKSVDVATNFVRDAVYADAMRPAVGLALADVFDRIAWVLDLDPDLVHRVGNEDVLKLARVCLGWRGDSRG